MSQPDSVPADPLRDWLRSVHRPAHARRTAERNAAFFLSSLGAGMSLLDIGCGPGSITAGLARAVAPGEAVGVDIDASAIAAAQALASQQRLSNVRFECANGYELPFPDATFDAVFVHFVLQHLNEPAVALAEVRRVLRPGGVVGVADVDYGAHLIWPTTELLLRAIEVQELFRARGDGDARIGRELGGLLAAAGFEDLRVTATTTCEGEVGARRATAVFQANYLAAPEYASRVIALGLADAEELGAMQRAWLEWSETPGAFWTRVTFEAIAWKR